MGEMKLRRREMMRLSMSSQVTDSRCGFGWSEVWLARVGGVWLVGAVQWLVGAGLIARVGVGGVCLTGVGGFHWSGFVW